MRNTIIIMSVFLIYSCNAINDKSGSKILDSKFKMTERTSDKYGFEYYLEGVVLNDSKQTWYAPWYISADFFEGNSKGLKMGTGLCLMDFNLLPQEKTKWKISFSPNSFRRDKSKGVSHTNLKAFIKNSENRYSIPE
jgi:hypothetical protein